MEEWRELIKKKVDHKHAKCSHHTAITICHSIEATVRCNHGPGDGVNAMTQERRHIMLMGCLGFCLPLVHHPHSVFAFTKSEHAKAVAKLLKLSVNFKPKPVAALIASGGNGDGGQKSARGGKNKDQKPKPKGKAKTCRKSSTQVDEPSAASTADPPNSAPPLVADPPVEDSKMLALISKCVDEGLWQLLAAGVNVDTDDQCKPKVIDVISVGLMLVLGNVSPIKVSDDESVEDLVQFREYASKTLGKFAAGYLAVKNWKPMIEPVMPVPGPSAGSDDADDSPPAALANAQPPSSSALVVLKGDQPIELLSYLRKHRQSADSSVRHGDDYKQADAQLLKLRVDGKITNMQTLMQHIVSSVTTEFPADWVTEASHMYQMPMFASNDFSRPLMSCDNFCCEGLHSSSSWLRVGSEVTCQTSEAAFWIHRRYRYWLLQIACSTKLQISSTCGHQLSIL